MSVCGLTRTLLARYNHGDGRRNTHREENYKLTLLQVLK